MRNFLSTIKNQEFFRNVFTLASGTAIAQAIPLLVAPILTRIYSPADFGLLAVFISITSLLAVAVTGRYELAILLPRQNNRARRLVRMAISLTATCSLALLVILLPTGKQIAKLFADPRMATWIYFIPLAVFLCACFEVLRYYGVRKRKYKIIAGSQMVRSATDSGTQMGLGAIGGQGYGLITAYLLSLSVGNFRLWNFFRKESIAKGELSWFELNAWRKIAGRYRKFPGFSLPAQFLNTASLQLPIFTFSVFFTGAIAGWYALAQRVLNAPMTLIGTAIGQVYFQKSAEFSSDPEKLKQLTWNLYRILLIVGILPLGAVLVFGDLLFGWVFGAEWTNAGNYASMLSVWILFVFISSPLSNLFYVQERQRQGLVLQAVIFASRFLVVAVCVLWHLDAYYTVALFGAVGALIFFGLICHLLARVGIKIFNIIIFTTAVLAAVLLPMLLIRFLIWM